jgi:hypothetical protein
VFNVKKLKKKLSGYSHMYVCSVDKFSGQQWGWLGKKLMKLMLVSAYKIICCCQNVSRKKKL